MENQVQETTKNEVANAMDMDAWGTSPEISANDIVIPKILPMQHMSRFVTDEQYSAKVGEFRESLNGKLLGGLKKPMEFIPFHYNRFWITFTDNSGEWEYTSKVPITAENDNWKYNDEDPETGALIRRDRTIEFYILLPSELEKGDALPYIVSFRRTSLNAAKKLITSAYVRNKQRGLPPAGFVYELQAKKETKDKYSYIVMDIEEKKKATDAQVKAAFGWMKTVKSTAMRVDDSDLEAEAGNYTETGEQKQDF